MVQEENVGQVFREPAMNLEAAIQVLSAVTSNIGCIAGADVAFDALKSVLAMREPITRMIEAMQKAPPFPFDEMFPPQRPTT